MASSDFPRCPGGCKTTEMTSAGSRQRRSRLCSWREGLLSKTTKSFRRVAVWTLNAKKVAAAPCDQQLLPNLLHGTSAHWLVSGPCTSESFRHGFGSSSSETNTGNRLLQKFNQISASHFEKWIQRFERSHKLSGECVVMLSIPFILSALPNAAASSRLFSTLRSRAASERRPVTVRTDVGCATINTRLEGAPGSTDPGFALLTLHHAMYSAVSAKTQVLFAHTLDM